MVAKTQFQVGQRCGIWTVQGQGTSNKRGARWRCICDCGTERDVPSAALTNGKSASCGCLSKARLFEVKWKGVGELGRDRWSAIVRGAQQRNLCVEVSIDDVWELFLKQNRQCALSNLPLTMFEYTTRYNQYDYNKYKNDGPHKGRRINGTASLDRIDSSKGYTLDNIQWIHKDLNTMKMAFDQKYFLEMCVAVAKTANLLYEEQ